ncbi:restriction endonuclease subunit S [Corynebacterium sp. ZY180755]
MTLPTTQKIRDVSDIVTKGTTPTTVGRNYTSSGINFLKVETFTSDGIFIPGKQGHIDESTHQLLKRSQLAEGDILFSIAGALGRSTIVDKSWLPANTNQAFAIIRPSSRNQAINPRYLLWQLRSPAIAKRIAEINVQAAQANLSLEQVREFDLLSLPRAEQNVIAAALDDVDQLVAVLERLVSKKQAIKQGLMQELLTGRTRLPGFNRPWHEKLLGDLTRIKTGSRNNQDKVSSGAYPFFVRSQTVERIDTYSYSGEAVLIPGEGGIGEIFHYINGRHEVHQRVYRISDFSGISGKFAFYYLQHFFKDHALRNTVKATVDSIRLPIIQSFKMAIPGSIDEQTAIAALLDDTSSEIDALERRLESARNIKQGMMQELLTGRTRLPVEEVS